MRADASPTIGMGHVMRCIALAEAAREQGAECIFVTSCASDGVLQKIQTAADEVFLLDEIHPDSRDLAALSFICQEFQPDGIILDGYHFDEEYQLRVRDLAPRVLVIDDTCHLRKYHCDILLNQNLGAERLPYSLGRPARLLLGPEYALIRQEFIRSRIAGRTAREIPRNVLVTLGGADPGNYTLKVMEALKGLEVHTRIVLGPLNPAGDQIESKAHELMLQAPQTRIEIVRSSPDMPALMNWADIAVTSASSTCWELMFMGVPMVTLTTASNQHMINNNLLEGKRAVFAEIENGMKAKSLREAIAVMMSHYDRRQLLITQNQKIIDGHGKYRILSNLLHRSK
ncbi:MAG: UDP-2,4-diacetamido-2,4,6-trideoxy-beta-L-altropyranose hydrolase [Methylacidiphilales bacterium]|nr:UDP-2,4-diacetamido-2,4,6-trideoxy-beta-L-altropyranose hydrolase [Candidatus Methylacidiphilales bacterium]